MPDDAFIPTEGPLGLYIEPSSILLGLFCVDTDPVYGPHLRAVTNDYVVRLMLSADDLVAVRDWAVRLTT